jgi:hypothetical protein
MFLPTDSILIKGSAIELYSGTNATEACLCSVSFPSNLNTDSEWDLPEKATPIVDNMYRVSCIAKSLSNVLTPEDIQKLSRESGNRNFLYVGGANHIKIASSLNAWPQGLYFWLSIQTDITTSEGRYDYIPFGGSRSITDPIIPHPNNSIKVIIIDDVLQYLSSPEKFMDDVMSTMLQHETHYIVVCSNNCQNRIDVTRLNLVEKMKSNPPAVCNYTSHSHWEKIFTYNGYTRISWSPISGTGYKSYISIFRK